MKIYLLIENSTNRVIKAYKYVDVAMLYKNRTGLRGAVLNAFNGHVADDYRVEVLDVVE